MRTIADVHAVRFNERATAAQNGAIFEQVLRELDLELLHIAGCLCPQETYLEIITVTVNFRDYNLHSRNLAVINLMHQNPSFNDLVSIYDKCIDGKVRIHISKHLLTRAETIAHFEVLVTRFDPSSWGYRLASQSLAALQAAIP